MKDNADRFTGTLEPLAELLTAHATLINETSASMADGLADSMEQLQGALVEGNDTRAVIQACLGRLVETMQLQDVLRQQVNVLISGIDAVSHAHVPANEHPEDWYMARLKEIEAAYVMPAQHEIHATLLGQPVEPQEEPKDGTYFF